MSPSEKAAHTIARLAVKHAFRTCKTADDDARRATTILNLAKLVEALVRLAAYRRLHVKDSLLQANGTELADIPDLMHQLRLAREDVLRIMDDLGIPQTEL